MQYAKTRTHARNSYKYDRKYKVRVSWGNSHTTLVIIPIFLIEESQNM